jgi:hypothetical protein
MAIIRLTDDLFEKFTLVTNPRKTFSSSSSGTTGSVLLYARSSDLIKEVGTLGSDVSYTDDNLESTRIALKASVASAGLFGSLDAAEFYMSEVNSTLTSKLNAKKLDVTRFDPPFTFQSGTLKKSAIVNVTIPSARVSYPTSDYSYTNYHTLNFFTASSVPSNSVIIYPNSASDDASGNQTRPYNPSGSFTFDFYVNPRYTTLNDAVDFHAGTVLHLSSTYAISLVSGSQKDETGSPSTFRLMLQLSHSADTSPDSVDLSVANNSRSYPDDLIFLSSDNSLSKNKWHHVAIRWGGDNINAGSGSFFIDGSEAGTFNVPSSSISTLTNNDAVFVGNYYQGQNSTSNDTGIREFFNSNAATVEGVTQLSTGSSDPSATFSHPLNAEIHDVKLFNTYRNIQQILTSSIQGVGGLTDLLFYVPPFFVKESRTRTVPVTPFKTETKKTEDPFNVDYSFSVGGRLINLENFTREFVKGEYPRLFHLTASVVDGTVVSSLTANDYLVATGSIAKRNLTILPADNGKFSPNFDLLASGTFSTTPKASSETSKFVNDLGVLDYQLITLRNLFTTSSIVSGLTSSISPHRPDSLLSAVVGPSPFNLDADVGSVPAILQETRDNTSNEVTFFDITNVMYGQRIFPNSLTITDENITGSAGAISIKIKDNGEGNLYRADCLTPHAKWASVGNTFYSEGVALVKSPHLVLFGKDQFEVDLQGEQNIHTLKINVIAPAGQINSSSNPSYTPISASLNANDQDSEFVYITGINFHDDNLNVVMRVNLAQPIIKRKGDKILFRPQIDF